tara:strand:+ start:1280 stop:5428 length:4149 start_codon:yes stop_codon:yes gene_type:complete
MSSEQFLPLNRAERDSETSWYKSFASGIASGIIKIPEGVVSLGAELIDLGADTDLAADVEQFFDKINIFEEAAEDRAIGKLTEAIIQVGVPGTIGFKAANQAARNLTAKAIRAKKADAYADFKKTGSREKLTDALNNVKDLNTKAKYGRYAVGVMGGAAGELFVADVEKIGTFGDMFDKGVTQLDREETTGKEEATRRLLNRLKFGSESLLLTPVVYGAGKSAKLLAQRGQELAYSNSKFDRWLDKYIRAPFSPRGGLTKELFGEEKLKQALIATDSGKAKEIVDNITRLVDGIYPNAEKYFGKSNPKQRDEFYKVLNDALFEGNLRQEINFKSLDDLTNLLNKSNVDKETRQSLIGNLNLAREEFVKLIDILDSNASGVKFKEGSKQLQAILKSRTQDWLGTTYKMFETKGKFTSLFSRYRPTGEAEEAAINFFKTAIKKTNPEMGEDLLRREATLQVKNLISSVKKLSKPTNLDLNKYITKTMEGKPGGEFIKQVVDDTNLLPKEIRELLGEIKDPRYSIYNAMTNLSTKARTAAYLTSVAAKNDQVQAAGGRGFFWTSEDAGKEALRSNITGIELVRLDKIVEKLPGAEGLYNPLANKWTTKEIYDAILNINNVADGLQGFVRGEGKEGAEAVASWLYRNLLIFPKGISQLSKTVFSVPTHIRNMLSAFGFSGANGILFENPALIKKAFAEGIDTSGLTKFGPNSSRAQEAYRELTELGVVNSQVQIGDLKALLKDVRFGEQSANLDSILSPFMRRMTKVKDFFQGKYVAEDDTFKITNYVVELDRLKKQVAKGKGINRNVIDLPENELILKFNNAKKNKTFTGTYDEFLDDFALKTEAANIVKNTVPNYAFVGSFVRTARLLPVGNFMSFPSEMIRTTGNIVEQGLREMSHKPAAGVRVKGSNIGSTVTEQVLDPKTGQVVSERVVKNNAIETGSYGVGIKRLFGMASFSTAVPIALTEGASALYDVSKEELDALRRFVPEWSKNSTLIPTRTEDGELRYTDFSHTNAYDVINRPLRTVINNIQEGTMTDEQVLQSFASGLYEAGAEIMNPFISESIWTEATADIVVRGGRTEDGRRLYTDQTSLGDKTSIITSHLIKALAPNFKPYKRVVQALTETPTERGEQYDVGPEIAGFMGLRAIKVDPLRSMDFKISEYQTGIRNARREFTGGAFGVLKGGQVEPNDIIIQFAKSNNARFNVQQNMFLDLSAAEILGISRGALQNKFKERQLSNETFRDLRSANFDAYVPSEDIEKKFKESARNLGGADPYRIVKPIIRRMVNDMNRISLTNQFLFNVDSRISRAKGSPREGEQSFNESLDINNYLLPEIQTPPLPPQPMPNAQVLQKQGSGGTMYQGLTPAENAYLSEEEKMIRLRDRGLV